MNNKYGYIIELVNKTLETETEVILTVDIQYYATFYHSDKKTILHNFGTSEIELVGALSNVFKVYFSPLESSYPRITTYKIRPRNK